MVFEGGPQIAFFGIVSNKMMKNEVQECVSKKHEFSWIFDATMRTPEMVKMRFSLHACCNLRGFGGSRNLMKMEAQMAPKTIKIEPLGAQGCDFRDFASFCMGVIFDEFLDRQKVGPESQKTETWAAKKRTRAVFGRGRRERRGAGEEKEEGLKSANYDYSCQERKLGVCRI